MTQAQLHAALTEAAEAEYAAFFFQTAGRRAKAAAGRAPARFAQAGGTAGARKRRSGAFALHARAIF